MKRLCSTMVFIFLSACSSGSGFSDAGLDADGAFDASDQAVDAGDFTADGTEDAGEDTFLDGTDQNGDVEDGVPDGGGDPGGVGLCRFDPNEEWFILGEILQMQSQDGLTCVWLQREDQCPPDWICKAHPFKVLGMRIGHEGKVVESYNPDDFIWTPTHHNWEDSCEARIGGVTYLLKADGYSYGNEYDITATGAENWGPVRLLPYRP